MRYILLLILFFHIQSCVNNIDYEEFLGLVNDLEEDMKYEEAYDLVQGALEKYPEHHFELFKELIFINEKIGNYEENLDVFRNGHKKGYFFLIHPSIPRYKEYLDFDDFKEISDIDLNLRDSASFVAEPKILVVEPNNFNSSRAYPLIFIYHGGGSNVEKAVRKWRSEELDKRYIKVFLQSSRHSDYNTFGWRNSDSIAVNILNQAFNQVIDKYKIDMAMIITAGISAGSTSALYSAFLSDVPVNKVISICSGIPEDLCGDDYNRKAGIRVILIGGEKDYYRPRQERLIDSLKKYNIEHSNTIIPGMGHEYPENFNLLLNRIL